MKRKTLLILMCHFLCMHDLHHCTYAVSPKSIRYMLNLIHLEMEQCVHMSWYCIIRF